MPDYELAIYKKALNEVAHILVTDANGTITYVNDKVCRLTKYSREELIGQNNRIFKSGYHTPEFYETMYTALKEGKIFKTNFKNKAKDGSFFWMDVTIIPFLDNNNNPYKFLTIRFDVTDKINEVALKEEFLANVSHDIRTPLHGMMSIVEMLKDTSLTELQLSFISHIQETSDHLEQLVNDLLDVFKIDSGKLQFESVPINIAEIANSLTSFFRLKAKNKTIAYTVEIDKNINNSLLGDPLRLRQIVFNLLENATKYTDLGTISLQVNVLEDLTERQIIEFNIIDTGRGISKEKLEDVFEKYIQSDSKDSRLYGGTGLGLSIVKNLIQLQQGSLSLKSGIGVGTTFLFTLPFKKQIISIPETKIVIEPVNLIKEPEKYKILVADDDGINRMIFQKQLQKFKYNFIIVDSGFEVLDLLEKETFDLLLLDMQMPGMNGDVVIQKIRNEFPEPMKYIPIICVSATVQIKTIQYIIDAGANAHLSKPYKENELAQIIASTIINATSMEKLGIQKQEQMLVNLETLKQFTEDDTSFMLELLEYFYTSTPELLENMQKQFKTNRFELAMLLHKYRSQVSLMGITELIQLTKDLEVALIESITPFDYDGIFEKIILLSKKALLDVELTIAKLKTEM